MPEQPRPRLDLPSEDEVCSYRDQGFFPAVLWLPPLGSEHFADEAHRQTTALIAASKDERDALAWVESHSAEQLAREWDSMPIWDADPRSPDFVEELARHFDTLSRRPTEQEDQAWMDALAEPVDDQESA